MLWLITAILAYFFLAVASVGDRFLLVGSLPNPKVYAFFIALLGGLAIPILAPFGFAFPDSQGIFLALAAGFIWIAALVAAFEAVIRQEVSRVVPAVGALVPIFTLAAAALIWQATLSLKELAAFLLLLPGGFLITAKKFHPKYFLHDHDFMWIVAAAALFAAGFLLMKEVFVREGFVNGFIWMRFGGLIAAFVLFLFREVRREAFAKKVGFQKKVFVPFFLFQAAGSVGFVTQNLAINFATVSQVSLVNALEGTRYLFLFLFVWLLAKWRPQLLKEEMRGAVLWQKIIAGAIIIFGIVFLAI